MSCLTKTCCDKKLDTTHLRKEAASFAGSVVGQAEKAAQWAAPHVSKAAGGVASPAGLLATYTLTSTGRPVSGASPVALWTLTARRCHNGGTHPVAAGWVPEVGG